jgi:PAS domain S-box-containing protein
VLGYTVEESLARTPLDLIHPDEAPRIAKAIERVREDTGAVARLRYRVRHKDGTWRTLDVVARNELDNPDVGGVLVNARDVTEQVQLAARLEQVREEEKSRIARDLHDQLGQLLTGLKLDLLWLEERLEAMEPTPVVRSLVERAVAASALSEQTVTEVQRIATDLRPAALDRLGLGAALQQEGRRFEARARVACRVELSEPLPPLPATRATALYRIAQEALTNVARHARAGQVVVRLEAAAGEVTLTVDDDGVGLEPSRAGHSEALGLAGMRERAELEGGELVLSGRPGGGTRVAARLPLHPGEEGGP